MKKTNRFDIIDKYYLRFRYMFQNDVPIKQIAREIKLDIDSVKILKAYHDREIYESSIISKRLDCNWEAKAIKLAEAIRDNKAKGEGDYNRHLEAISLYRGQNLINNQ